MHVGGVKVGKSSGFKLRTQNSEYKWNADYLIGQKTRQGPGLGLHTSVLGTLLDSWK